MKSSSSTATAAAPACSTVTLSLLIVVVVCVHGTTCFQRFSEQPKYTEVNPGQDALLTCKVIDKRGTCSWQKDNKPVGIYAKKYEWAARPSSGNSGSLHLDLHPPPMQIGGDCSLWIRSATLDFDDGLWECQVTASDFTTQDALTSQPVRLVVRVAPQRPRLEFEGAHVPPGHNITVDSGSVATVKCVSHYGNPPATLKWFLGDQEISPIHAQTNSTEPDNSRTWSASSVVQVGAMRERHGDILRCLAFHESYTAKSVPVEARMDIKYAPTIRLIGSPEIDLEEDKDALILRCVADANPPASIVWRRAGRSEIASLQETLQLRPVGRRDAGLYTCQAQNSVGTSEQLSVQLDVKYAPKILSAGPDRLTTAPLFSPAAFECIADGNPMPTYKWVQRISHGGSKYVERGHEPRLVIDNVTYDYQGEYECRATSYINGQERVAVSDPVSLQVVGAPQVLRLHPSMHTISVKRGDPASLSMVVCADPRPHRVAWEWGSLRLEAGSGIDRFRADDVLQDSREDCYLSTLHIHHTDEHDSRPYYLVVENERGTDRHAVQLNVEEPLEMSYLLGIAGGCLAAILILICLCIYAVRSKKCCFKDSSGYKSSDKDSEKADLKSRSDSTNGLQGDSIYTTPAGFHHQQQQQQHHLQHQHQHPGHGSPEAMKRMTAVSATALDDCGNLLWQQEAAEFIERYPQRRRPHALLRPSASAGTLHKSTAAIPPAAVGGKRASGGELLTAHQRHQRDLFSGDLGIPEISTHVGSVVHTFETMALQRRQAQQQQAAAAAANAATPFQPSKYLPPAASRPTHGTSNSKYHQLKRKSHEARLRLLQQAAAASEHRNYAVHPLLTPPPTPLMASSCSAQALSVHADTDDTTAFSTSTGIGTGTADAQRSTLSLSDNHSHSRRQSPVGACYRSIDEDYRKNLFGGTLAQRQRATSTAGDHRPQSSPQSSVDADADADEAIIVNAAFDEIFAGYSGVEEDDDDDEVGTDLRNATPGEEHLVSLSELDDEVFQAASSSPRADGNAPAAVNVLGRPGSTPKRLPPLAHKKGPPPPPPAAAAAPAGKRKIVPLAAHKQRASTLANLFGRLKAAGAAPPPAHGKRPLSKVPSDSLLRHDQLNASTASLGAVLHRCAPQLDLHHEDEEPQMAAASSDGDFLRGSTLSQSFVHQLKAPRGKPRKPPAPAPPVPSTCSPMRGGRLFPKRSKSSNELLLGDFAAEKRHYYSVTRRSDAAGAAAQPATDPSARPRFSLLARAAEI